MQLFTSLVAFTIFTICEGRGSRRNSVFQELGCSLKQTSWINKNTNTKKPLVENTNVLLTNMFETHSGKCCQGINISWNRLLQIWGVHSWKEERSQQANSESRGKSLFYNLHQLYLGVGAQKEVHRCLQFESFNARLPTIDQLEPSQLVEDVRLLLNSWSDAQFYSIVQCNQLRFYGVPPTCSSRSIWQDYVCHGNRVKLI